jgi:hypothetical protein
MYRILKSTLTSILSLRERKERKILGLGGS